MASPQDMDWIVISLRRTPERLDAFSAINAHLGLPFEVQAAVDGLELDGDELVRAGLSATDQNWPPGSVGAALSHRQCWLRTVESGRPACIFEDDAILRRDFVPAAMATIEELPANWDIVHFGFNFDAALDVRLAPGLDVFGTFSIGHLGPDQFETFMNTTGRVLPFRLNNVFGTCAYAVSPAGARKLLEGCFPLSNRKVPVRTYRLMVVAQSNDTLMNALYRRIGAYVCLPPIVVPINDKQASTVKA